jgi:hypothetical protein
VLQEVQRVQLAPVDQAPTVVAEIDPLATCASPRRARSAPCDAGRPWQAGHRPNSDALDRLYRPQALDVPVLVSRDGPIAAIDPRAGRHRLAGSGRRHCRCR